MNKKNLLSGRDRELAELAEQYENAKAENRNVYMDADDLADLADWYEVRQQPDMAMEVVEYGLKLHPASFALLTEKAYLFLDYHDTDSAQEIVDGLNAKSTETKIIQAQIYILQGKDIQAKQVLSTISDKESVDTMVSVAYMYVNTHHPEEALKWLEPGIGKYEDDEPFMCIVADSYYGLGRLDEAMEIYNRLIDLNPYSSSYWYGLARCYFDKQMYDKAIESCDYANLADEDFPDAYMMKGHAFFYLQNDAKALENFRKAQELGVVSASFVATFIGLGYMAEEKWAQAYAHLQDAIDNYEDDDTVITLSMLYANAGLCLRKMGQKRKANQYWKLAHEENPEDPETYLIEGKMYLEEKNYDKCERCWAMALQYAPTAYTWHEIGMACLEQGGLEQGRKAFENVKQINPDFHEINEKLATVCLLLKDKENFQKYNQLCKHPITMDDLQRVQEFLKKENQEGMLQAMRNILKALQ